MSDLQTIELLTQLASHKYTAGKYRVYTLSNSTLIVDTTNTTSDLEWLELPESIPPTANSLNRINFHLNKSSK